MIKNRGKATLNKAFIEKVGSVKIGVANLSSIPEKLICDCNNNKINPKVKTHTIAYLAENLLQ